MDVIVEEKPSYEDCIKTLEETHELPHWKEYFSYKGQEIGRPIYVEPFISRCGNECIKEELGFYHLFYKDRLVYIGMSRNLRGRIMYHYKNPEMIFDAMLIFYTPELNIKQVLIIESKLIKHFEPPLNISCLTRN